MAVASKEEAELPRPDFDLDRANICAGPLGAEPSMLVLQTRSSIAGF